MRLLDSVGTVNSTIQETDNGNSDRNININNQKTSRCHSTLHIIAIFIAWHVYIIGNYIFAAAFYSFGDARGSSPAQFLLVFVVATSVFKWMLKKLARKVDIDIAMADIANINTDRINIDSNQSINNSNTPIVALEMTMELIVDTMYYLAYYQVLCSELAFRGNMVQFGRIVLIHILSETCQSIIRFSNTYFYVTSQLISKFKQYYCAQNSCFGSLLLMFVIGRFKDNSNLNEWRIRQSIDTVLRHISSMIWFINFMVGIQIKMPAFVAAYGQSNVNKALTYMTSIFCVDMLYFLLVFEFNYFFRQEEDSFNIWKPFLLLFENNRKHILLIFWVAMYMYQI